MVARVARAVEKSVVAIDVRTTGESGTGSGVIIDKSGYIVTNNHVVAMAAEDKSALTEVVFYDRTRVPARIIGGAIAAVAFALASYAERRALSAAFFAGAIGAGVTGALYLTSLGPVFSYAIAAIIVGLLGGLAARRALTPPLVIAVAGITPLLPGSAIYRGMYGLMNGTGGGRKMATAVLIG